MTSWKLIGRSMRFYWRTNLGVMLGVLVSTAVLVGSLVVGDSVDKTLRESALVRLGNVQLAMQSEEYFFRAALADELGGDLGQPTAAVISLPGVAVKGSTARAGSVGVLGVDDNFWRMAARNSPNPPVDMPEGGVIINEPLARQLSARQGDRIVLTVEKPGQLPPEAPLSSDKRSDLTAVLTVTVAAVASPAQMGHFSLHANQVPPMTAFLPREFLAGEIDRSGRANMLLVGTGDKPPPAVAHVQQALQQRYILDDLGIQIRPLEKLDAVELRTSRVYMAPPVAAAAGALKDNGIGLLSYFVIDIASGNRMTPYSMVTAIGPLHRHEAGLGEPVPRAIAPLGAELADDQIILGDWTRDDFVSQGGPPPAVNEKIKLTYFTLGQMRQLQTQSTDFRLGGTVPMTGIANDPTLLPDFPGIAGKEIRRDLDGLMPIDLTRIRMKDEDYWDKHRGTPKAFISLAAGQRIWGNRYGDLTAIRWPSSDPAGDAPVIAESLKGSLDVASLGLSFRPVRDEAMAAASPATDFGQLFLGFSVFLIVSSSLLTGLLFVLGVQQRQEQVGMLLAVGIPAGRIRRLLLAEGLAVSVIGALLGVVAGMLYTRLMLAGLSGVWSQAVGSYAIAFALKPLTLAMGFGASVCIAAATIFLAIRRQARRPASQLLSGLDAPGGRWRLRPWLGVAAIVLLAGGAALMAAGLLGGDARQPAGAAYFFGAASMILVSIMLGCWLLLAWLGAGKGRRRLGFAGLAIRNAARRPGRSMGTIALLACGTFMIVAVAANRHDPAGDVRQRSSPTGGYSLIGRTSLPVFRDLNTADGRKHFGLDRDAHVKAMEGVSILPLRVRQGADASCLNLNKPSQPQILGVDAVSLAQRGAFRFARAAAGFDVGEGWRMLDRQLESGVVPAVADVNTITWSMGKRPGDEVVIVDDAGRHTRLLLVGMIDNSILQGSLVISQANFQRHFPAQDGFGMFLIDAPPAGEAAVAASLTDRLSESGMEVTASGDRLRELARVEHTYLSIFEALGGLGLILGTVALAVVVLRNVLERRGELAILRAVGFTKRKLQLLVLCEHFILLGLGIIAGVLSAMPAILPAILSPGAIIPYNSLGQVLMGIFLSGLLWAALAVLAGVRGPLIEALRAE